jgi:hypothetical protein
MIAGLVLHGPAFGLPSTRAKGLILGFAFGVPGPDAGIIYRKSLSLGGVIQTANRDR